MGDKVIKSVRRVFEIFEAFDEERRPLSANEISKRNGYPLASSHALLKSIRELGYVDFNAEDWTYVLSPNLPGIMQWIPDPLERQQQIVDFAETLNRETRETVNISRRIGTQMRIIKGYEGKHPVGVLVKAGQMMPVLGSLTGLTALAAMPASERKHHIELEKRTGAYDEEKGHLIDSIAEELRSCGTALRCDLLIDGVGAVCVPMRLTGLDEVVVLGVAGPSDRIKKEAETHRRAISNLATQFDIETVFPLRA